MMHLLEYVCHEYSIAHCLSSHGLSFCLYVCLSVCLYIVSLFFMFIHLSAFVGLWRINMYITRRLFAHLD